MNKGTEADIRRLAVILRDSSDAITVQDLQGNIKAWNRGAERMYGYTESEALRMNISQIILPDKRNEEMQYIKQISLGRIVEPYETKRVKKTGEIIDVWIVVTCLTDDSGVIDSIATTERDITDIKNELNKKGIKVKILRGFLPICASCKKIMGDDGHWHQVESYIKYHSEAEFSHSVCPKCVKKLYPHLVNDEGNIVQS